MKNKVLFFTIISLFLLIGGTGCGKEDVPFFEVDPYSDNPTISTASNDISFKFYMLNEKGEKATVFDEGVNFSFCYSVTNNREDSVEYYPTEIYTNRDFFAVKNSNGDFYERPSGMPAILKVYRGVWIKSGETLVFNTPWIDNRESWNWELATFLPVNQQPLPKGDYYTEFTSDLDFNHRRLHVENFTFRINFKVQ